MRLAPSANSTWQRSAMSSVLSQASGSSDQTCAHLGARLEVEVARVEAEPLRVVHGRAGADAQQDVVRVGVGRVHVVQVVGGDQRQVEGAGDAQQVLAEPALDGQPVVHELAEVVAGAEDVAGVGGDGERAVVVARLQPPVDLAARAAGGADQPGAVALEQLPVEARLVVVALEAGQRGQPEQVVHARGGLGPQGHVGVALLASPRPPVEISLTPVSSCVPSSKPPPKSKGRRSKRPCGA